MYKIKHHPIQQSLPPPDVCNYTYQTRRTKTFGSIKKYIHKTTQNKLTYIFIILLKTWIHNPLWKMGVRIKVKSVSFTVWAVTREHNKLIIPFNTPLNVFILPTIFHFSPFWSMDISQTATGMGYLQMIYCPLQTSVLPGCLKKATERHPWWPPIPLIHASHLLPSHLSVPFCLCWRQQFATTKAKTRRGENEGYIQVYL